MAISPCSQKLRVSERKQPSELWLNLKTKFYQKELPPPPLHLVPLPLSMLEMNKLEMKLASVHIMMQFLLYLHLGIKQLMPTKRYAKPRMSLAKMHQPKNSFEKRSEDNSNDSRNSFTGPLQQRQQHTSQPTNF